MPTKITLSNVKIIASSLRSALADYDIEVKHSQSLHILSKALGYNNWNTLLAKLKRPLPSHKASNEESVFDEFFGMYEKNKNIFESKSLKQ